jgi:hypothetical protein
MTVMLSTGKLLDPLMHKQVHPRVLCEDRLRRAVCLSRLSYNTPDEMKESQVMKTFPPGVFNLPMYHDGCRAFFNRSCQAYVWRMDDDSELCVSFRGTVGMDDVVDAVNCGRTRVNLSNHMDLNDIFLHTGFVEQFMSIQSALQNDVLRTLRARPSISRISFVGHSMGGGVAQVACLYFGSILKPSPHLTVQCTALGTPKLGDGADLDIAFQQCAPDTVHLVNNLDIVPSMPCWFRHPVPVHVMKHGKLYVRPSSNHIVDGFKSIGWHAFKSIDGQSISDHRLDAYMAAIDAMYEKSA